MHYTESKGILTAKNGMNLYRGCSHGCIYCDSRSRCYQFTHDFEDIEVKSNALELLEDALRRKRKKCMIGTGSMTDPYVPLEKELEHVLKEHCIGLRGISGFLWAVHRNPYFLSLFYYRIGQSRAYICSFFKRDSSELNICCESLGAVKFYHPFSTILNAESIGNNFVFRNNTTIGNVNNDYSQRPIIGDNVELGANVIVFGNIRIGNNVKIGAGAIVVEDVPSNSTVVCEKARIIRREV